MYAATSDLRDSGKCGIHLDKSAIVSAGAENRDRGIPDWAEGSLFIATMTM